MVGDVFRLDAQQQGFEAKLANVGDEKVKVVRLF
jgi:hypothetical protein